jgi:hypothetical protein
MASSAPTAWAIAAMVVVSLSRRATSIAAAAWVLCGFCLTAAVAVGLVAPDALTLGWVNGADADEPPDSLISTAIATTRGGTNAGLGAADKSGLDASSMGTVLSRWDTSCRTTCERATMGQSNDQASTVTNTINDRTPVMTDVNTTYYIFGLSRRSWFWFRDWMRAGRGCHNTRVLQYPQYLDSRRPLSEIIEQIRRIIKARLADLGNGQGDHKHVKTCPSG